MSPAALSHRGHGRREYDGADSGAGEDYRSGMGVNVVNGVDIGASIVFPRDGLCPTCREPFFNVETSAPVLIEHRDGRFESPVEPVKIEGPNFRPCGHDARGCFPSV